MDHSNKMNKSTFLFCALLLATCISELTARPQQLGGKSSSLHSSLNGSSALGSQAGFGTQPGPLRQSSFSGGLHHQQPAFTGNGLAGTHLMGTGSTFGMAPRFNMDGNHLGMMFPDYAHQDNRRFGFGQHDFAGLPLQNNFHNNQRPTSGPMVSKSVFGSSLGEN